MGIEKPYDLVVGLDKVVQKQRRDLRREAKDRGRESKSKQAHADAQPANGADASALRASAPLIGALGVSRKKRKEL